jgi:putative CocE/NonD family hydrolase
VSRADVLVYTSPPFEERLAILGPVDLVLHASTSARDTDFVADLYDVAPDGREMKVVFRTAVLRARYREGYERQVPMAPGVPTELRLRFHDMGHVVLPGHRLKLEVSSSTPGIHPNPNTGADIATDTQWVEAQQRVYYGGARPSRLELPVIEVPK